MAKKKKTTKPGDTVAQFRELEEKLKNDPKALEKESAKWKKKFAKRAELLGDE